jgi:protein-L-isoaspartate(D-aspartate) O-methyltransferase
MKRVCRAMVTALLLFAPLAPSLADSFERVAERDRMAETIGGQLKQAGVRRDRFVKQSIAAIRNIPRHLFVPEAAQAEAYLAKPLAIGHGQTISDPFIVALMTSLLHVKPGDTILEIGTGSGYQAAVLSQLGADVLSVEIVEPLALEASARLVSLGYTNVKVRAGDGYAGWSEHQPFDSIIVTAGATHIPPALIGQLKPGGRMVIPLGPNWAQEQLMLITKRSDGSLKKRALGHVFFVDFTGVMRGSHKPQSPVP